MLHLTGDRLHDFSTAIQQEWLLTNGLGGFASSTVIGANTRRYHGLLVAATKPPLGRVVLVSKLDDTLIIGDERYELGCNQYPGVIHPQGHRYLEAFRLDPFPTFVYAVGSVRLEKSIVMVHGENTTVILYRLLEAPGQVTLDVRPMIAFREYHSLAHENPGLDSRADVADGLVRFAPYAGLPSLFLAHDAESFGGPAYWFRTVEYPVELERGLDYQEDLYSYGSFTFHLQAGESRSLIASDQVHRVMEAPGLREKELARRAVLLDGVDESDALLRALVIAADTFIVRRGSDQMSIIAGYHWFGDWGRDTMIALPGLTLVTGRFDVARAILAAFAQYCDRGMIPNRFPDAGEVPEYNTVDASLWFIHAVTQYLEYTNDIAFIRTLFPVLQNIILFYREGTRYHIRMDDDGLITAGEEGVQLTWMDAKVGDWVVTPRRGKAVEINALWYNALRTLEALCGTLGRPEYERREYGRLAQRVKKAFNEVFWNEEAGSLYDCVDGETKDPAIRPNQLLAISLPHSLLTRERARCVLNAVTRTLYTPVGLRSLAPESHGYTGRYGGDQWHRDSAYHQGTVWGWLIGPFIDAYVQVHGSTTQAREEERRFFDPFRRHLSEAGLETVSEIFDGDPPYTPRGCIAQAWSVAEVLRVYVQAVLGRRMVR